MACLRISATATKQSEKARDVERFAFGLCSGVGVKGDESSESGPVLRRESSASAGFGEASAAVLKSKSYGGIRRLVCEARTVASLNTSRSASLVRLALLVWSYWLLCVILLNQSVAYFSESFKIIQAPRVFGEQPLEAGMPRKKFSFFIGERAAQKCFKLGLGFLHLDKAGGMSLRVNLEMSAVFVC